MYGILSVFAIFILIPIVRGNGDGCVGKDFGYGSVVCVCNATYCDSTPKLDTTRPNKGDFSWYVTSKSGMRLSVSQGQFNSCKTSTEFTLTVDSSKTYQTIFGFGGAFTDSAGLNIKKLSEATQEQLMRSYFDPKEGSGYTLGRVPIGGSDFSTRPYTYDDVSDDVSLKHFGLAKEDYDYKIPYMKRAVELNPKMRFLSAAWTAPPWMKTNNAFNGLGVLKNEHYQTFADYLVKFLDAYKKEGLDIWAMSTGNEPLDAFVPNFPINSMGWIPSTVRTWVANNLGPTLEKTNHSNTLILALDDQRFELPWTINEMFANEKAKNYTAGIAVHWYWDNFFPTILIDQTHDNFPDKFLLMTEACAGSAIWDNPKVQLGSWTRGEEYILNIIENLSHWMVGWVDWNLALDSKGGPNWINNFVDSPIIVNPEKDEFYKQPMYYALKHFSRFVDRGSKRISITDTDDVKSIAFKAPSSEIVVVLYNKREKKTNVAIADAHAGSICLELPPYSMHTVIYKQ